MPPAPITADDLDAWRENAVTRFVLSALETQAAAQAQAWSRIMTEGEPSDRELADLRLTLSVRADTLRAMAETDYARLCEVLEMEER